tara:strand:+ start:223 stop:594 length:372 start_codon:yes stop_codon:yes gene_type:complete
MSEDIKHHVKIYRNVFIALLICTALTVYASYIEFSTVTLGLLVGLLIASVKGYLVAANFMHLNNEKSFIYGTLLLTVIFFIVLMSIPLSWDMNGFDIKTDRNNPFDEYKIVKDDSHGHGEEDH